MIPDTPAIELRDVSKRFADTQALKQCSLVVARGEFVSLLGPSGCGKTTLLRAIGGFERQDQGSIRVHGRVVDGRPPNKRPVNTVFQRYALFPHRSVFENIAFPLELQGLASSEIRQRVGDMLELVRLPQVEQRKPDQLSGGQAQRVALARALVSRPEVLLLDEPLTALDLQLRKTMQLELRGIHEKLGTTFLYVTHDQSEALTMSDRIVLMNSGAIVQQGSPAEIYNKPASIFASSFVGETNLLEGTVEHAGPEGATLLVGDLRVQAPPGPVTTGNPATLAVRPERVHIGEPPDLDGFYNCFSGTVDRQIFLGNIARTFVRLPGDVLLIVEQPSDAPRVQEGCCVKVAWRRENSTLLHPDASE